jgi:hypothetical protein
VHRRARQDPHLFNRLGIAIHELKRQAQPRWQSTWTGALFGFVAAIAAALALFALFALDWLDLGYGIFTIAAGSLVGIAVRIGSGGFGDRRLQPSVSPVALIAILGENYLVAQGLGRRRRHHLDRPGRGAVRRHAAG